MLGSAMPLGRAFAAATANFVRVLLTLLVLRRSVTIEPGAASAAALRPTSTIEGTLQDKLELLDWEWRKADAQDNGDLLLSSGTVRSPGAAPKIVVPTCDIYNPGKKLEENFFLWYHRAPVDRQRFMEARNFVNGKDDPPGFENRLRKFAKDSKCSASCSGSKDIVPAEIEKEEAYHKDLWKNVLSRPAQRQKHPNKRCQVTVRYQSGLDLWEVFCEESTEPCFAEGELMSNVTPPDLVSNSISQSTSNETSDTLAVTLKPGVSVEIRDLTGAVELNGRHGKIVERLGDTDRWKVMIVEAIKSENLMAVQGEDPKLRQIYGLPDAAKLNGQRGMIGRWLPQQQRYEVMIHKSMKPQNLVPIGSDALSFDEMQGHLADAVPREETVGLAPGRSVNVGGQQGVILRWVANEGCYEVGFDGVTKQVKAKDLSVI